MKYKLLLVLAFCLLGCSREPQVNVNTEIALTVDEWKKKDVFEKYELETFERLKLRKPELNNEISWDQFMRDVVVPERRIDIPTDY